MTNDSESGLNKKGRFGEKLHHNPPHWVDTRNADFHIRIRIRCEPRDGNSLTIPEIGGALLESVHVYTAKRIWWATVFLLMPDHLHAILSFNPDRRMSRIIGDWKKYHKSRLAIEWQENYFDHRIRHDESFEEKVAYIRRNPVVQGLCENPEDWPWVTWSRDDSIPED